MSNRAVGRVAQIMVMAIVISVMLLFAGIGLLILIHICIVGRAFRRGFSPDEQRGSENNGNNTGISEDDLDRLPSFHFQGLDKGNSPIDCAVCLETFQSGDKCRMLPVCKHSFHAHCVDSWLLRTPICPICRSGAHDSGEGMELVAGGRFQPVSSEVVVGIPVTASPSPLQGPLNASVSVLSFLQPRASE